jgi:hypothetical protein
VSSSKGVFAVVYAEGVETVAARVALPVARPRAAVAVDQPDEVVARELRRNDETLAVLRRLGVGESETLRVSFVFETGGPQADRELAAFLANEAGYEVSVDPEGVSGRTKPIEMSSAALELWVRAMLRAGNWCGGCAFGGWTVAVCRGA